MDFYCFMKCILPFTEALISSFLYCLDATPIFVATTIFVIPGFFPGKLLNMNLRQSDSSDTEAVVLEGEPQKE
jgi:hypothetical protein